MGYIHLAGAEAELSSLLRSGTDAVLVSYYYVRRHKQEVLMALADRKQDIRVGNLTVILDSGAFSYFKRSDVTLEEIEEYLHEYVGFIRQHHEYFTACVELDVGTLDVVGFERQLEWRRTIFEKLTQDIPDLYVIYVWHSGEGLKLWEEMCRKYPYVGIGSDANNSMDFYSRMVNIAKRYKAKVHGFAITSKEPCKKIMFFSVDSTTHIMGGKFGATFFFTGQDLVRIDGDKTIRNRWKNKYIKKGFNWDKIEMDVRSEINAVNAYAWVEYSTWLEKKRRLKVYWRNDCGGKVLAAFDNLYHSKHLSKAAQMAIPWGLEQWQEVMSRANVPVISNEFSGDGSKKRKKPKYVKALDAFGNPEPSPSAERHKDKLIEEALRYHAELSDEEDWEIINDDPMDLQLKSVISKHVEAKIQEMKKVAPDLLEKSLKYAEQYEKEYGQRMKNNEYELDDDGLVTAEIVPSLDDIVHFTDEPNVEESVETKSVDEKIKQNDEDVDEEQEVRNRKGLYELTDEDRQVQLEVAKQAGIIDERGAVDLDELERVLPMRSEDFDPADLEGPATPLDKKQRRLVFKKFMRGLQKGNSMLCNTCYVSDTCPLFQRNSTCAFQDQLGFSGRRLSVRELTEAQKKIAEQMLSRAQMALLMEQMQGGYPDRNATYLLESAFGMLERTKNVIADERLSNIIGNTFEGTPDASDPEDDTPVEHQSVLAQIFQIGPEKAIAAPTNDDIQFEVEKITDAEFVELTNNGADGDSEEVDDEN